MSVAGILEDAAHRVDFQRGIGYGVAVDIVGLRVVVDPLSRTAVALAPVSIKGAGRWLSPLAAPSTASSVGVASTSFPDGRPPWTGADAGAARTKRSEHGRHWLLLSVPT